MRAVVWRRCLASGVSLATSASQDVSLEQQPLASAVVGQRLRWISVPVSEWQSWHKFDSVSPARCSLACGHCPFEVADFRLALHLLFHLLCSCVRFYDLRRVLLKPVLAGPLAQVPSDGWSATISLLMYRRTASVVTCWT